MISIKDIIKKLNQERQLNYNDKYKIFKSRNNKDYGPLNLSVNTDVLNKKLYDCPLNKKDEKIFKKCIRPFAYAHLTIKDFLELKPMEIYNILKYDNGKVRPEFEKAGGSPFALYYISMMKEYAKKLDKREKINVNIKDLIQKRGKKNNKPKMSIDYYFPEIIKEARNFGIENNLYVLLQDAVENVNKPYLNEIINKKIENKELDNKEKTILMSYILGKMKMKDMLINNHYEAVHNKDKIFSDAVNHVCNIMAGSPVNQENLNIEDILNIIS